MQTANVDPAAGIPTPGWAPSLPEGVPTPDGGQADIQQFGMLLASLMAGSVPGVAAEAPPAQENRLQAKTEEEAPSEAPEQAPQLLMQALYPLPPVLQQPAAGSVTGGAYQAAPGEPRAVPPTSTVTAEQLPTVRPASPAPAPAETFEAAAAMVGSAHRAVEPGAVQLPAEAVEALQRTATATAGNASNDPSTEPVGRLPAAPQPVASGQQYERRISQQTGSDSESTRVAEPFEAAAAMVGSAHHAVEPAAVQLPAEAVDALQRTATATEGSASKDPSAGLAGRLPGGAQLPAEAVDALQRTATATERNASQDPSAGPAGRLSGAPQPVASGQHYDRRITQQSGGDSENTRVEVSQAGAELHLMPESTIAAPARTLPQPVNGEPSARTRAAAVPRESGSAGAATGPTPLPTGSPVSETSGAAAAASGSAEPAQFQAAIQVTPAGLSAHIHRVVASGAHEARLHLEPESLGPLDLTVRHEGGRVSLEMTVSTPEALEAIEATLPALRAALEERGLPIGELRVSERAHGEAASPDNGHGERQQPPRQPGARAPLATPTSSSMEGSSTPARLRGTSTIDYRV